MPYHCVVSILVPCSDPHLAHATAIGINCNVNVTGHGLGNTRRLQEEGLNVHFLKTRGKVAGNDTTQLAQTPGLVSFEQSLGESVSVMQGAKGRLREALP